MLEWKICGPLHHAHILRKLRIIYSKQTQSTARQQLHELHQSKLRHLPSKQSQSVRGLGARLGIAPASTIYMMNHGNNSTGCNVAKDSTWSSLGDVATAWLGGGSSGGHMCGADRSRSRGGDGGEWGGAFTNRKSVATALDKRARGSGFLSGEMPSQYYSRSRLREPKRGSAQRTRLSVQVTPLPSAHCVGIMKQSEVMLKCVLHM